MLLSLNKVWTYFFRSKTLDNFSGSIWMPNNYKISSLSIHHKIIHHMSSRTGQKISPGSTWFPGVVFIKLSMDMLWHNWNMVILEQSMEIQIFVGVILQDNIFSFLRVVTLQEAKVRVNTLWNPKESSSSSS